MKYLGKITKTKLNEKGLNAGLSNLVYVINNGTIRKILEKGWMYTDILGNDSVAGVHIDLEKQE